MVRVQSQATCINTLLSEFCFNLKEIFYVSGWCMCVCPCPHLSVCLSTHHPAIHPPIHPSACLPFCACNSYRAEKGIRFPGNSSVVSCHVGAENRTWVLCESRVPSTLCCCPCGRFKAFQCIGGQDAISLNLLSSLLGLHVFALRQSCTCTLSCS